MAVIEAQQASLNCQMGMTSLGDFRAPNFLYLITSSSGQWDAFGSYVMPLCGTDSNIYNTKGDGCTLRKREREKGENFSIKKC